MKFKSFLVKYGEIGVKGKNRFKFEDALIRQIRLALKKVDGEFSIVREHGRIYVDTEGEYDYEDTVEALKRVFGLVTICPIVRFQEKDFAYVRQAAVEYMRFYYSYLFLNHFYKIFSFFSLFL